MAPASAGTPARRRHAKAVAFSATALTLGSWLLVSAPAARADCPVLDPACLTDAVTQTVDDVIDTATTTTQQVVDQTTDVTDPVVDTVVETVDPAVTGVLPSPAPGTDPSDPAAEPGVTADAGSTPPVGAVPESDEGTGVVIVSGDGVTDPARPADGGSASRTSTSGETGSSTSPVPAAAPAGRTVSTDPTQIDVAPPGIREQAGFGFGNAVKRLAFPLVLVLAVGVFFLAQHRFDRRAPKLALAPVEADVATFS